MSFENKKQDTCKLIKAGHLRAYERHIHSQHCLHVVDPSPRFPPRSPCGQRLAHRASALWFLWAILPIL